MNGNRQLRRFPFTIVLMDEAIYRVGTAGWGIPKAEAAAFPATGSHLERYAAVMNSVEINSTFYRLPQTKTLTRWAATTPEHFRFAVKLSRTITHEKKLQRCGAELVAFFLCVQALEAKLGPTLVQLPPKLAFDGGTAYEFLTTLREVHPGPVVLEPRHESWFTVEVDRLLREFEVASAMADPPAGSPSAAVPGGWKGLRYFRLHGSPRKYWSAYEDDFLREIAAAVSSSDQDTWVIFDNTAQGHALTNAMKLKALQPAPSPRS